MTTTTIEQTYNSNIISDVNDILAVIFILILVVIYLPQLVKIYKTKSSIGINIWYMFLGHTASMLTAINSLTFYINGWYTCSGFGNCTQTFVGYEIILTQWILFLIMYIMYIIYIHQPNDIIKFLQFRMYRSNFNRAIFGLSLGIGVIAFMITTSLLGKNNWHYYNNNKDTSNITIWTSILEGIILVFFLIHYIPQIYECWRIKAAGSISLITLSIMCPGSFVWTIYLALQGNFFTNNQETSNPMVWIPYLIVGVMQAILLGMGIYYEMKQDRLFQQLRISDYDSAENSTEYLSSKGPGPVLNKIVIY